MKKLLFFLAAMALTVPAWAGYGILVNGCDYYPATHVDDNEGFSQYLAHVTVAAGDYCQMYDDGSQAAWMKPLNTWSEKGFATDAEVTKINCTVSGCYDFYIKLKYGADELYIGKGSDCGTPTSLCPTSGFYIAGNGTAGNPWCCGIDWQADGCALDEATNSITFTAVPAGEYKFKLTNGTWTQSWGAAKMNAAASTPGWAGDADGNVSFKIASAANITVAFDGQQITLTSSVPFEKVWLSSVPSQCTDIILQGFYYDSYEVDADKKNGTDLFGDTRWTTLERKAGEIGVAFDYIWLPPSGYASGTGYHPRQYSNQNSDWGSRAELQSLIRSLHNVGTKVVADIVINHIEAMASWCDLSVQNFGDFGTFTPDGSWICNTDEMNNPANNVDSLAGDCYGKATGNADDGENWEGARDWSHDLPKVQDMFKAYLQWMRAEIGYDGWRYDKGDGFNNWHMWNYNQASQPEIAFMECWKGNNEIKHHIDEAKKDVMAFDFQNMYYVFNDGISKGNFGNCGINGKTDWGDAVGLVQSGYQRNAVTFIENHDMFMRNDQEFGGNGNSMKPAMKDRLLQANAYLLSMPGVPCVFYPHWYQYTNEINAMINARRVAGVHSESEVREEEVTATGYKATVVGKNGLLIITLGDKTITSATGSNAWLAENHYEKLASGNGYAMWVQHTADVAARLMATPECSFSDAQNGIKVGMKAIGGTGTATIYYTTDGTEPTTASAVYSDSLTFTTTTTLKALAVVGTAQSKVYTFTYTYREPLARGIQVRFRKPDSWQKVYFYAWQPFTDEEGNASAENINGAYPGQRIYPQNDGWYMLEFDASMDSVNFCINSGSDCGMLNVRSNDLVADYDVCYGWQDGADTIDRYEVLLDCETQINPDFDLCISPESSDFRDLTIGQKVTINTIGSDKAMIYYTTDGTEPNTGSQSAQGQVEFTVNATTTVRAYAVLDQNTQTEEKSAVYSYKAPQSGPMTVRFFKPHDWQDLYLYAFTRVKVGNKFKDTPYSLDGKSAKWPGMKWTTFEHYETDSVYTHTFSNDLKEIYVIFNIGSNKKQTQDIYLDENTCFVWNEDCYKAVVSPKCDGVSDLKPLYDSAKHGRKYIINDRLFIEFEGVRYDVLGRKIK